ncbi:MAG: DUF4845 domain-containing protein [Pseudomonadales bacterium]|nr:DUF4845 domain-containing protein [Pseudomonadales bacterium]
MSEKGSLTGGNVVSQGGKSLASIMVLLVGLIVVLNFGFKTIPHYLDFDLMTSLIAKTPPELIYNKPKRRILETLTKRFKLNNLRDHKLVDVVDIQRSKEGTVLTLHYVITEHLAGNADLTMTFNKTFEFSESGLK